MIAGPASRLRTALCGAALIAALYLLLFFQLSGVGLIGPDEPRYAAIAREMAASGDWLTPRLWGEPWFEKPPLLYWLSALGFLAGLGDELAPRLPVASISVAFLVFYFLVLRREFGAPAAGLSTAVLGTSAAWLAFSQVGVTDLPMAAAFSAAVLLSLRWIERGDASRLTAAGALLGVAVLAKGFVPVVLAVPVLWIGRQRLRDLLRPALVFAAVAAPWYVAMSLLHGRAFFDEFFWRHHLGRFASDALRHEQPFWFYVPVILGLLVPWTPSAALLFRRKPYRDPRLRALLMVCVFGLVFFSVSANKLPGYLLPLVPAAAALIGTALVEAPRPAGLLTACAALLILYPVAADVLPQALARGITHAEWGRVPVMAVALAAGIAAAAGIFARRGRVAVAVGVVLAGAVAGAVWLKISSYPVLDRTVSARAFWNTIASRASDACVETANRSWRYNLNYYSRTPLPDCAEAARPLRIVQQAERAPRLETRER